jgi:hypothetical protein
MAKRVLHFAYQAHGPPNAKTHFEGLRLLGAIKTVLHSFFGVYYAHHKAELLAMPLIRFNRGTTD